MFVLVFCLSNLAYHDPGPYGVNGVPLRRVNQRFVIATSTKVSLDGVNVSAIDDAHFAREKVVRKTGEQALFDVASVATVVSPERKALQTAVDAALTKNIGQIEFLSQYLQAKFSLSKADRPHLLKF